MTPPTPTPSPPTMRSRRWIWIAIVLAIAAIVAVIYFMTLSRGPKPIYGSCVKPDGTVLASNITQADCQNRCPTCTWRQEN